MSDKLSQNSPKTDSFPPEESNVLSEIGTVIKRARVEQNFSLEEIATSLKIGEEQLRALEQGEVDLLPETVFIKAMIKRVSEKLNLDSAKFLKMIDQPIHQKSLSKNNLIDKFLLKLNPITSNPLTYIFTAIIILAPMIFYVIKDSKPENSSSKEQVFNKKVIQLRKSSISKNSITLTSKEPSWISLRNKQGEVIYEGELKNPLSYEALSGIEIFTKRPDLILVKTGEEYPTPLISKKGLRWHYLKN